MELEEGEYIEEEKQELFFPNKRQKNNVQLNVSYLNSIALKRRREEDDYETVSMDLDSEPELSRESKTAEHHSEDEVELLRRQLLSQVRQKKAKQQTMNGDVLEKRKGVEECEKGALAAKMDDLERRGEKLRQLNEQLTEAQLWQSTIVRRKKRLQDSLVECEEELTRSQLKISSVVEEILGLWSEATKDGLKNTLTERKGEMDSQKITAHKENAQTPRIFQIRTDENSSKKAEKASELATLDKEQRKKEQRNGKGREKEDDKAKRANRKGSEEKQKKTRETPREDRARLEPMRQHQEEEKMQSHREQRSKSSSNRHPLVGSMTVTLHTEGQKAPNSQTERTVVAKSNAIETANSQTERTVAAKGNAIETANSQTERTVAAKGNAIETANSQTERTVVARGKAIEKTMTSIRSSAPIPPSNSMCNIVHQQTQETETTEKPNEEKHQGESAATGDTAERQRQEEAAKVAPNYQLGKQSDAVDGFLASIRAYRLNPRFSHNLLAHPSVSNRLDPFVPLCPFQLHGRCADTNCPWQHEAEYLMSEVDIVSEVVALWPSVCPRGMLPQEYATALLAKDRFEVVIGFLLSIMPEEAFSIKLATCSRIPRLASKPIPADENIEFVSLLSTKHALPGSSTPIC